MRDIIYLGIGFGFFAISYLLIELFDFLFMDPS